LSGIQLLTDTAFAESHLITSRRLIFVIGLIALIQVTLATLLDLYSDEIFYWQASTLPAPAYSDLPFMTSLLAGLGSLLAPGEAVAVRIPFIILGTLIPVVLFWVARPVTGKQQALEAAALSLCLPLGGFLGLLAVPDVPLIFFGLLTIGFFERAVRTDRLIFWAAAGFFAALGFSTHYRFFPYALAVLIFLLVFQRGSRWWKNAKFWLALTISSIGLLPVIWFNLNFDLSSLGFYLVDRHPWEFQLSGLLHLFKQAFLVTPLLYALLVYTMWSLFKDARNGNLTGAMFFCFAAVNVGIYLVLAPWTDNTSTSIHWPLSGYFPLLVYAPASLRECSAWLQRKYSVETGRRLTLLIPGLGLTGTLIAFIGIGSQAFHTQLQPLFGKGLLSDKMTGWKVFSRHTEQLISREFMDTPVLVISDNYYTSAQLDFGTAIPLLAFTIDSDKAIRDGRIAQYAIWQRDIMGLKQNAGRNGLFISEDSTLTIPDKYEALRRICGLAERVTFLEQLDLFNGVKRFSYYRVDGINAGTTSGSPEYNCPFPSQAWIDTPQAKAELSGIITVSGWAFNEDLGVRAVAVLVDGKLIGNAYYGIPRPDVAEVMNVTTDPGRPNLGFEYQFDSRSVPDGYVTVSLMIENQAGERQIYGERPVKINN